MVAVGTRGLKVRCAIFHGCSAIFPFWLKSLASRLGPRPEKTVRKRFLRAQHTSMEYLGTGGTQKHNKPHFSQWLGS